MYYAHRTVNDNREDWQQLSHHLKEVQDLSGLFAESFGAREWGETIGLLHDLGKYSQAFQNRLMGAPQKVDHATAGAQTIAKAWTGLAGVLVAYVIAGHHAGLQDYGSKAGVDSCLAKRLLKRIEPFDQAFNEISIASAPLQLPIQPGLSQQSLGLQLSLFTRMLFSCLVDADSLNTEHFCDPHQAAIREQDISFAELERRYDLYMSANFAMPQTEIERFRGELLTEGLRQSEKPRNLFTLTLPTGSGKTLLSLGFALKHARFHQMQRIIYVIPYTSIIEQNAAKIREVLGEEYVLEYHSNLRQEESVDNEDEQNLKRKLELAGENWDYPVVVTTNVQFFESLFSNKRSRCRKLHNYANSVIILDEAQMMNGGFFKPCLYMLEELVRNYGATVIMCTATQPNVGNILPKQLDIQELISNTEACYKQFERVRLRSLGIQSVAQIAKQMSHEEQVLCIVNTRKNARELYEALIKEVGQASVFHLSARMCPIHRGQKFATIRKMLAGGERCVVISTQLIEAGVDIDFSVVFRELAGLDSIAQAAGRCNRHGLRPIGQVAVFELECGLPPGWFSLTAGVTREILRKYPEDALSLAAIREYFDGLYFYQAGVGQQDRTDAENILPLLNERIREENSPIPFAEVSSRFKLIDTDTQTVIIPYLQDKSQFFGQLKEDIAEWIRRVEKYGLSRKDMRKLQGYGVQLYRQEFEAYRQAGKLVQLQEGVWMLEIIDRWYDEEIGLKPFSEKYHAAEVLCL